MKHLPTIFAIGWLAFWTATLWLGGFSFNERGSGMALWFYFGVGFMVPVYCFGKLIQKLRE